MRILFAAGGTGGHINPALAIASTVKSHHPETEILFAGTPWGMEARFVKNAGYNFAPIKVRGIERGFSIKAIRGNFKTLKYLLTANKRAKKIIKDFNPDMVIGTGGYVSGPVVRAAAKMGIKTLIHEQNAYPGVTTKLLARDVDVILLAFGEAEKHIKTNARLFEVGNPVREEFLFLTKKDAREKLGIPEDKTVILSCGGSLGAKALNLAMAGVLKKNNNKENILHIHATGNYGFKWMPQMLGEMGVDGENIKVLEFIDNMPLYLAACDLIISRSGAITLSEIEVQGKAAILIPSPNVTENHQYHNAMVLANAGAAVVIEEKDLDEKKLYKEIDALLENPDKLKEMGQNAQRKAKSDANSLIYEEVMKLYKK